jgi:hypothetical protein
MRSVLGIVVRTRCHRLGLLSHVIVCEAWSKRDAIFMRAKKTSPW